MKQVLRNWVVHNHPELLGMKLAAQEMLGCVSYDRPCSIDAKSILGLAKIFGDKVMSGPFAGMIYNEEPICSEKWPKILGSYEKELAGLMEKLIEKRFRKLIDVGCAEGYYAVGFAWRCPDMNVVAIDPLKEAANRLRRLALANEVQNRIKFHRFVSAGTLDSLVDDSTLIIMDCEGVEIGLLTPAKHKQLRQAEIVVEVHDFAMPGMTEELVDRFQPTHNHCVIEQQKRIPADYSCLASLDTKLQEIMLNERRPRGLRWLHLTPRDSAVD